VATQASSPLLHQRPLTDEQSESVGSNSNISKEVGGIQPKTIRRSLNWQNISVEAPSRGNGMSKPGGIQRQQEEPPTVMGDRASADSAQKSALESSNSTISTDLPAQKPLIARAPFNGRNIPIEAPVAGQRPAPATSASYEPRSMRNNDLEARARGGDQSALDELNYRELVYQRHQEVQRTQPIEHPQSQQRLNIGNRGLGELPPPTRRTVEASRRVLAFLEATAQSAESARVQNTPRESGVLIPPKVGASRGNSFAVNVTEVQTGNGQRGFVVSLSGDPQAVQARLNRLQQLSQELGGEFEFGPAQAGNYATNPRRQRVGNFPGGEQCAEPRSFYQADGRPVEGTATVWFGRKNMEHHELPGLLDADPSRRGADIGSHGMYMLPCPSCEVNSGGMMSGTVY